MKNIIISTVPLKNILTIFFAGFIGAWIFGVLFFFIGLIFAKYLGFNILPGVEEIVQGESAIFYTLLCAPFGALIGSRFASKLLGYKSKFLYSFLTALFLVITGLFLREYFSLYTFLINTLVGSMILTVTSIYFSNNRTSSTPTQM